MKTTAIVATLALLAVLLMACTPPSQLPSPKQVNDNAASLREQVAGARQTYEEMRGPALQALSYAANVPQYAKAARVAHGALAALPGLLTAADIAVYRYQYAGAAYEETVRAIAYLSVALTELDRVLQPLREAYDAASAGLGASDGRAPGGGADPPRTAEGAATVDASEVAPLPEPDPPVEP